MQRRVDHLLCYEPKRAEEQALDWAVKKYGQVNGYCCIQCGSTLYGKAKKWCNGKSGPECRRAFFAT